MQNATKALKDWFSVRGVFWIIFGLLDEDLEEFNVLEVIMQSFFDSSRNSGNYPQNFDLYEINIERLTLTSLKEVFLSQYSLTCFSA